MKITILVLDSRGDVQPFVPLERGLQKNGHEVKLATPHRFADFVGAYGVSFVPWAGDPPLWGKRVHAIGAGPRPISIRKINTQRLVSVMVEAKGRLFEPNCRLSVKK